MVDKERVTEAIFMAVDEVNEQLLKERSLEKSLDTVLFGNSSKLDSLGMVSLITAVEQKIEEAFGASITLADERALSQQDSPFKTIGTLTDYIALLLNKE